MIPSRDVFNEYANEYDQWFDDHNLTYQVQLRMLHAVVPEGCRSLEVGAGSGRFAVPLGIHYGIDPSPALLRIARGRGVEGVIGEGEHLPYRNCSFDCILMMTVICFLVDPLNVFHEVFRVLAPKGNLIVGFIEKDGEIATLYRTEKTKGRFLQYARFVTVKEVIRFFHDAGFIRVSVIGRSRGFCVMIGLKREE